MQGGGAAGRSIQALDRARFIITAVHEGFHTTRPFATVSGFSFSTQRAGFGSVDDLAATVRHLNDLVAVPVHAHTRGLFSLFPGVLIRKNGGVEILTKDHGTLNPHEIARIQAAGGSFRQQVPIIHQPSATAVRRLHSMSADRHRCTVCI